jgi:type IV pilus assembly protein PilB
VRYRIDGVLHEVDRVQRAVQSPLISRLKMVLRVLDTGGIALDLNKLGFSDSSYGCYARSFTKPHGMVLITGPHRLRQVHHTSRITNTHEQPSAP